MNNPLAAIESILSQSNIVSKYGSETINQLAKKIISELGIELPPNNLPSHIPCDAKEKTEYVFSIAPYFKELAPETRFFVFDGKVYSFKSESSFNGKDWSEFCEEIATK